jgi:hypothetical protein
MTQRNTQVREVLSQDPAMEKAMLSLLVSTPEAQWATRFPGVSAQAIKQFAAELPQSETDLDRIYRTSVAVIALQAKNPDKSIVAELEDNGKRAQIAQAIEVPIRDLADLFDTVIVPAKANQRESLAGVGASSFGASSPGQYRT